MSEEYDPINITDVITFRDILLIRDRYYETYGILIRDSKILGNKLLDFLIRVSGIPNISQITIHTDIERTHVIAITVFSSCRDYWRIQVTPFNSVDITRCVEGQVERDPSYEDSNCILDTFSRVIDLKTIPV